MSVFNLRLWGILLLCLTCSEGTRIQTLKKCCNLGTNHANSGLKCSSFKQPISDVAQDDRSSCLNSADACCKEAYREKQCKLGELDALTGSDCTNLENEPDNFRNDCCEACKIGLETEASDQSCNINLGLGQLMDSSFKTCCLNKITTTATQKTQQSSTTLNSELVSTVSNIGTFTNSIDSTNNKNTSTTPQTKQTFDKDFTPPPPSLEALCDLPDLCDHVCIPVDDLFKCDCHPGFVLMEDGKSCQAVGKTKANLTERCDEHNPCQQECIDTGVAIKCSCYKGYQLQLDKITCKDIDECSTNKHNCSSDQLCVNMEGFYDCQNTPDPCPSGYKLNRDLLVCNDINECQLTNPCLKNKLCENTIGSYKCIDLISNRCPSGFYFEESVQNCDDVDECITGKNDCNKEFQDCLNTKGNYTCIDKAKNQCPPGFKKNLFTRSCEDIDECVEKKHSCSENEECVNEPGGHDCILKSTTIRSVSITSKQSPIFTDPFLSSIYSQKRYTYATTTQKPVSKTILTSTVEHISSFASTAHPTTIFRSLGESPVFPFFQQPNQFVTCSSGYKFSTDMNICLDIDECIQNAQQCDSNQDCFNTPGSYTCECKVGFTQDFRLGACIDINECQIGQHDCIEGQRCDNTIGSYLCARTTGCGTGYTLNSANGLCEDDDECALGIDTCYALGSNFHCRNTQGSYRCERIRKPIATTVTTNRAKFELATSLTTASNPYTRCLPGYRMNTRGTCEDVDECSSNPCKKHEKCLNLFGRYQCIPGIQCKAGYQLNESGNSCVDINECALGTHQCKASQICKNGPGYYLCQCPPGHKLNSLNECEDIDECEFYKDGICSRNAHCVNTIGSYKCQCKEGFKENGQICDDVNECDNILNLCHQNCINLWGSYRCSCERGFILNKDNRTCTDIDECEKFKDKNLCVATCQNIPGSYTCTCPDGYRKGNDGRTCQDIDECRGEHACSNYDDVCINIRGSYKCQKIVCPPYYVRDPEHKSRCKRASNVCDFRDMNCIKMPSQYSYHFVTFISKLPIPDEGRVDFFQMKAPLWSNTYAHFTMQVRNIMCPRHNIPADERFFLMKKDRSKNKAIISLIRSIEGPQEIELQLQMELYISDTFQGKVVSTVYVIVSEYSF